MAAKCHNCDRAAMWLTGEPGQQIPLCLDCWLKLQQGIAIQTDQLERGINYATEQMEAIVGLPGILPRYPLRRFAITPANNVVRNNINVSNSNIGVLNTGNLEIIDFAITQLNQDGGTQNVSQLFRNSQMP